MTSAHRIALFVCGLVLIFGSLLWHKSREYVDVTNYGIARFTSIPGFNEERALDMVAHMEHVPVDAVKSRLAAARVGTYSLPLAVLAALVGGIYVLVVRPTGKRHG